MANVLENPSVIVTLIVQIVLALVLIVVVLFQSSNQEGLSGAIAGGANNFFGKNKGRTVEAKLKKLTAIIAVLFLISSVLLAIFVQNAAKEAATVDVSDITIQQSGDDAQVSEGEIVEPTEGTEGETAAPVEGEEGTEVETVEPVEGETVEPVEPIEGENE